MSVPTVPKRSLQQNGTRSSNRSHRSLPLKGGNVGNADHATAFGMDQIRQEQMVNAGMNKAGSKPENLVPMPRFLKRVGTAGGTHAFALCGSGVAA